MSKNSGFDSYEEEEELSVPEKIRIFFVKNRKKNLKALLIAIIIIVLIVVLMVGAYVKGLLNKINRDENTGDPDATFAEEDNYDDVDPISDVCANSIDQYCIQWATNGDKLRSSNVINILLIGRDGASDETNSDTIIIASVNTQKKVITLCSVMRDSYTYSNINGSARCDKINHTYAWGGAEALKTTLEDDLKITIDHYASINFKAFREMIDEIGGVDVPVTEAEANYMNRTTQMQGFESGDSVHLDGAHALVFARIRKLDSDINRTHRQRLIITSVLNKLKNSSASQLNSLVNKFLPYVTTDCSNKEILSYASQAISGGWLKFSVNELTEPGENYRAEGMMTTYSSRNTRLFVWIVDWALVAKEVQTTLYGTTNIEIDEENHTSPMDIINGSGNETTTHYYTSGSYGDSYDETTESRFSFSVPTFFDYDNYTGIIPDFTRPSKSSETEGTTAYSSWSTEFTTEPDTEDSYQQETTRRYTTTRARAYSNRIIGTGESSED